MLEALTMRRRGAGELLNIYANIISKACVYSRGVFVFLILVSVF
jgi:hypothetical protein